jgi:hypothetical protein
MKRVSTQETYKKLSEKLKQYVETVAYAIDPPELLENEPILKDFVEIIKERIEKEKLKLLLEIYRNCIKNRKV